MKVVIVGVKLHTKENNMGNDLDKIDYFSLYVLYFSDYYVFGSLMPGRCRGADYRYGWNKGSEKDDEITGVTG